MNKLAESITDTMGPGVLQDIVTAMESDTEPNPMTMYCMLKRAEAFLEVWRRRLVLFLL